jgi:hypothetical protein
MWLVCAALSLPAFEKMTLNTTNNVADFGVEISVRKTRETNARKRLLCWVPTSVALLLLRPLGVHGCRRDNLPFPWKCEMESGWDPGGWTTAKVDSHRCPRQPFALLVIADWVNPARKLLDYNATLKASAYTDLRQAMVEYATKIASQTTDVTRIKTIMDKWQLLVVFNSLNTTLYD